MGQARVGQILSKKPGSKAVAGIGCGNIGRQGACGKSHPSLDIN